MNKIRRKCKKGLYEVELVGYSLYLSYHDDIFIKKVSALGFKKEVEKAVEREDWRYFEKIGGDNENRGN